LMLFVPLASADNWDTTGNDLTAVGKLGSKNAYDVSFITNDQEAMRITTGQKIGIGTMTPQEKLTLGSGSNFAVEMTAPSAPSGTPYTTGGNMADNTYYYVITALNGVGETIKGTESSGIVIYGGTPPGSGRVELTWAGVTGAQSYKIYRTTTSGTYSSPAYIGNPTTTSYTDTLFIPNSGEPPSSTTAYVNKITAFGTSWFLGGNVGIGTATPGSNDRLTIKSIGDTNLYYGLRVQNSQGDDQFVVRSDGNVGIGTNAPISKLSVAGGTVISTVWAYSQPAPANGLIVEGLVGFGTINPQKALEINSATGANLRLVYNDANGPIYSNGYTDFDTDRYGNLFVKPTGTGVCIGTPNPGMMTPQAKLEVTDSVMSTYTGSPIGYFGTITADTIALVGDSSSTPVTLPSSSNIGICGFGDDYAGYFVGKGYFSDNVGIGTPTTLNKLDVSGAIAVGASYAGSSTAPSNGMIIEGNVGIGETSLGSNDRLTIKSAGATSSYYGLKVQNSGGTNQFVVRSDGKVGIGLVGPTEMLEVDGDACADSFKGRPSSNGNFLNNGETYGFVVEPAGQIFIGRTDIPNFKGILMEAGTEKVSMGTATISHRLTIASTDEKTLRLIGPDGGSAGYGARLNFGDGDFVYIEEDEDDHLYIYGDDRTTIMGGNVGIGNDNPATKLHVNGDVAFGDGSEKTIQSGTVTVTHTYHTLDTENNDDTDELWVISGGDTSGQILVLRAVNSDRTVVAKDGGNMQLSGDFSMDNAQDTLVLIYDDDLSTWFELSRSDNGA